MRVISLALGCLLGGFNHAFPLNVQTGTNEDPVPVRRTATPPKIDGRLDDNVWRQVTVVSDFKQRLPVEGDAPSELTEVYLTYTSDALYVGFRAYHTRSRAIVATAMRRDDFDQLIENEQFSIAIDSYNDGRNGYLFSTNPLGIRVDAQFFNDGDLAEANWDGLWLCEAQVDEDGWSAELEIPFSTLRFKKGEENVMGINLFRRIIETNEQLFAPLIPLRYAWGTPNVSAARKYLFRGITGGGSAQIKPYMVGGLVENNLTTSRGTNETVDFGLDARYNLTNSLTANVSINTDFAQAEVDERQINLTRFSLFFPEKRDFFLENAGTFSFGIPQETEVFFSRRIGLGADSTGDLAEVPILLGAKLTGRVRNVEVGVLDVQTRHSDLASRENSGVARVKVGISPRSYVGGIVTNKLSAEGQYDRTYGADLTMYLAGDIGVSGFASTTHTSERRYRLGGASAYHLALFKGGERVSFNASVLDVDSAFDPALGFVPRQGVRKWFVWFKTPWYVQSKRVRRITPGAAVVYYDGHDGVLQSASHRLLLSFDLQSEDQATFYATRYFEKLPFDFPIFRDVVIRAGRYAYYEGEVQLTTKQGRPASGELILIAGSFFGGSRVEIQATADWKASRHLMLSQTYGTSLVDLPDDNFRTHIFRSRGTYALDTHLSVAGLLQYDNASEQLGVNLRLAYLFREGTELFLVYNGVLEEPGLRRGVHVGSVQTRSIIMKLTYLFGR